MLASQHVLQDFNNSLPSFHIPASHIEILDTPSKFHDYLISGILNARRRIFLSSLYIGGDADTLRTAIRESLLRNPNLSILVLLDKLRTTRPEAGQPCLTSLLGCLVQEFGYGRVEIRLYNTPRLGRLWQRIIPRRLDEGFGLQHIKLYGFDDRVMVTGANLAGEYFTNRQDRYYVFSSRSLTQYFDNLSSMLAKFCHQVLPAMIESEVTCIDRNFMLKWPDDNHLPRPLEETSKEELHKATRRVFCPILWKNYEKLPPEPVLRTPGMAGVAKGLPCQPCHLPERDAISPGDTIVYPLAQLAPIMGSEEGWPISDSVPSSQKWALLRLLLLLPRCDSWTLATPYFKPPAWLRHILTQQSWRLNSPSPRTSHKSSSIGSIITASAEAMSFYGAKGIAGYIPQAFGRELENFAQDLKDSKEILSGKLINVLEWQAKRVPCDSRWTFHGKGWWLNNVDAGDCKRQQDAEDKISMTLVGSSNYGERSFKHDLEVDVLIVTTDKELKRRLQAEEQNILNRGKCRDQAPSRLGWLEMAVIVFLMWIINLLGLSI